MTAARAAVTAFFALDGFVISSFFARLPAIQDRLRLDEGDLALALAAAALGLLVAQPLAGAAAARWGSAPLVRGSALAASAAVVGPGIAGSLGSLVAATAAIGVATGVLDVSMNIQGVAVERRDRRPILSSLHALFSLGVLAGAATAGAAAAAGVPVGEHLPAVAAAGAVATLVAGRGLLPAAADARAGGPAFARPTRRLAGLGAIAFCVLLAEGAVADWSAIHLAGELDAPAGVAALGLAGFSLAMAAGRLAGDRVSARVGAVALTRAGAAVAGAGLVGAAFAPGAGAAIAGFAVAGAGLSALFPLAVRAAAARAQDAPGPAIAAISTTGYAGLVSGPPLVGLLAEAVGLRLALGLVLGVLCALAVVLAPAAGAPGR
ncbi:MAG TPA: MFS transporter [Solirubrobacteraceae bacterium]|nr:MFS transporter [Solirubrobacteraceae bacterium]